MSNQNTGQAFRKEVANVKDFSLDKNLKKLFSLFAQVVRKYCKIETRNGSLFNKKVK